MTILLFTGGTAIFLMTFVWERDFVKRAFENQMTLGSDEARRTEFESLQRERNYIEWVRAISAAGMLVGLLLAMYAS